MYQTSGNCQSMVLEVCGHGLNILRTGAEVFDDKALIKHMFNQLIEYDNVRQNMINTNKF